MSKDMRKETEHLLSEAKSELNFERATGLLKGALEKASNWRRDTGVAEAYLLESEILAEQALNAQTTKDRFSHWSDAINILADGWKRTSDLRLSSELAARVVDFVQDPYSGVQAASAWSMFRKATSAVNEALDAAGSGPVFAELLSRKSAILRHRAIWQLGKELARNDTSEALRCAERASEEKHNQITQTKNSFAITLDAIGKSIILGIPTDIHFVPTKVNYEDLPDVVELSHVLGIQNIRVLRFVPHGRGGDYASDLLPSVNDYRAFAQLVAITRRKYPGLIHIGAAFSALIPGVSNACSAATGKIVVTADGFVAPCDGFKNFDNPDSAWSVYNRPLHDIYANSPVLCRVRAARNGNTKGRLNNKILATSLGCMAQKSLACGSITSSGLDPCVSIDSRYREAREGALQHAACVT